MEKFLFLVKRINDTLSRFLLASGALIIAAMVLTLFAGAMERYIIGSSHAFLEELPRIMIPFLVFPLMGVLLRAGRHIGVDVLSERFKGIKRNLLMIAVYVICIVVGGQFTIAGIFAVLHFKTMGLVSVTEWVIPVWLLYSAFPLGFGLLFFAALELLLRESYQLYETMNPARNPTEKGKSA